jgi:Na+/phosphate symporter
MLTETTKALLEFLKLTPRYLIAFFVMASVLLFCPEEFLKFIGVLELAKDYRAVLGLAFVVTGVLLFISFASALVTAIKRMARKRQFKRRVTERLNGLTEDEKEILRFYIAFNTRANTLRIDDGVVQGLVASGIIYRSASLGNALEGWAHNIHEFAWDYLQKYPILLEGTSNATRTDRRRMF